MTLLADSNIWVALALSGHQFHEAVRAWFAGLHSAERVGFCRSTQQSFLRLITTQALLNQYGAGRVDNQTAWTTYEKFRADPQVTWLDEPAGLEAVWKRLTAGPLATPKKWMDAYLAAFALAGGHRLVTTDQAFTQFAGLRVVRV